MKNDAELQAIEAQISAYYTPQHGPGQIPNLARRCLLWAYPRLYLLTSEWNGTGAPITTEPLISLTGGIYGTPVVAAADGTVSFPARAAGAAATALIL